MLSGSACPTVASLVARFADRLFDYAVVNANQSMNSEEYRMLIDRLPAVLQPAKLLATLFAFLFVLPTTRYLSAQDAASTNPTADFPDLIRIMWMLATSHFKNCCIGNSHQPIQQSCPAQA